MLKKILFVAALIVVMLPVAAADKAGKWYVDLDYGFENPSGLDTIYAYSYGYNYIGGSYLGSQTKTFTTGPSNAASWKLTAGYEAADWKAWASYFKLGNDATSLAAHENDYYSFVLFNTLPAPVDPLYGYEGFVYSDEARANTRFRISRIDINAGRNFNPTDNWKLTFYSGLMYMNLETSVDVLYIDNQDWNYWGAGSTDQVILKSNSKGWGINLGFVSSTQIGKRVEFNSGLEVTMARLTRNNEQTEWFYSSYYSPDYGPFGSWNANQDDSKMTPIISAFVEADIKITDRFFTQIGYKYMAMKDVLSYNRLVNDYPMGSGWASENKDFGLDGLYLGLTFKF